MVSGGTYGTEDIVRGAGYGKAILILLLTPTSLEPAHCLHDWRTVERSAVRRRILRLGAARDGQFLGISAVAWLSLVASIFDMAIYPTCFCAISHALVSLVCGGISRMDGRTRGGGRLRAFECCRGSCGFDDFSLASDRSLGARSFRYRRHRALQDWSAGPCRNQTDYVVCRDILTGLLICMWKYMGWDNASTIATEVERPQRTYPRAMLAAVVIVALSYIVPVAAMWLSRALFQRMGDRVLGPPDIAGLLGGPLLRVGLALGGMISGFGMFNALVMSYSRLPLAMAQDGMLPRVFGKLHPRSRAPWVAIVVCAVGWALCLGLGFERLVTIDILLYGASLSLEFIALIVLRVREPELHRPFRVPGGMFGAVAVGIAPMLLLGFSVVRSETEQVLGMSSFAFGMLLIAGGVVAYLLNHALKPEGWTPAPQEKPEAVA